MPPPRKILPSASVVKPPPFGHKLTVGCKFLHVLFTQHKEIIVTGGYNANRFIKLSIIRFGDAIYTVWQTNLKAWTASDPHLHFGWNQIILHSTEQSCMYTNYEQVNASRIDGPITHITTPVPMIIINKNNIPVMQLHPILAGEGPSFFVGLVNAFTFFICGEIKAIQ